MSVADTGLCFLALVPLHAISALLLFAGAKETAGKYRGRIQVTA